MKKTIINRDIGRDWEFFKNSSVKELVHSGAVVVETGDVKFVYLSGRTATDGDTDVLVGPGDIEAQTEQVLKNLLSALEQAGGTIDDIVRMRVYVTPPYSHELFAKIHEVRARYFNRDHYPASTLVVVHQLARAGAMIEIDADAVIAKA
jgi:2-iminobutanoate/2-iminopropanoate deaminase